MNNEDRKEKFSADQKKKKKVNIGVKVGRGNLTFGADARVEFNSSSVKNYRYMNKGECCPKPKPKLSWKVNINQSRSRWKIKRRNKNGMLVHKT